MYNPHLHFHFTGIGGSGMSGIAELLLLMGFSVSGSDLSQSSTCDRLESLGAQIFQGHKRENLPQKTSVLVYTSAVSLDINEEILEAQDRSILVVKRAEVLAELIRLKYGIVVSGSHGKTTTTSLIGAIFEEALLDPTVFIGGKLRDVGSGSKLGRGEYIIAESDESDRSFLLFKPTVGIITNIDQEHMAAYASYDELKNSFLDFIDNVPFYGLAVLCADDADVVEISKRCHRRKLMYGFSDLADVTAKNVSVSGLKTTFTVVVKNDCEFNITINFPGRHMVQNTLAAISVALEFGIEQEVIQKGLAAFSGVKRRLEVLFEDKKETILSDYGHHPVEIKATLAALRKGFPERKIKVLFQPHRYSRTKDCYQDFCTVFNGCDELYITQIHAASEEPIVGISAKKLSSDIVHPNCSYVETFEEAKELFLKNRSDEDIILCLGAGSIGAFAEELAVDFCSGKKVLSLSPGKPKSSGVNKIAQHQS